MFYGTAIPGPWSKGATQPCYLAVPCSQQADGFVPAFLLSTARASWAKVQRGETSLATCRAFPLASKALHKARPRSPSGDSMKVSQMPQELSNTKHPGRLSARVLCVELADFLAPSVAARAQRTRLWPSGVRGPMDFWALARFVPSEAGVRLRDLCQDIPRRS